MLKNHRQLFVNLMILSDTLVVALAWMLAYYLRYHGWKVTASAPSIGMHALLLVPICLIWAFVLKNMGVYKSRRITPLLEEVLDIVKSSTLALIILIGVAFFLKKFNLSRLVLFYFYSLSIIVLSLDRAAFRFILRIARERGYNYRRILIIGAGNLGRQVAKKIKANAWTGLAIMGYLDDKKSTGTLIDGKSVLGEINDVERIVAEYDIDHVFVTLPASAYQRLAFVVDKLSNTMVNLSVVPDIYQAITLNAGVSDLDGLPVINLIDSPIYGWHAMLKRAVDIASAAMAIIITAPVMTAVAVAVKLTSKGPVLFKQRRYGIDGKVIWVYKFRSMTVCEDGDNFIQAKKCDPRLTSIGAFLRRTSLDELPQFFNVLEGNMSVVGPRPHPVALDERFKRQIKNYVFRHKVKPGITGWAQINGWRGETDTIEKMQSRVKHDLFYIENWSLWFDIKIMLFTVWKSAPGKNIY